MADFNSEYQAPTKHSECHMSLWYKELTAYPRPVTKAGGLPRSGRVGMYPRAGPIPLRTSTTWVLSFVGFGSPPYLTVPLGLSPLHTWVTLNGDATYSSTLPSLLTLVLTLSLVVETIVALT